MGPNARCLPRGRKRKFSVVELDRPDQPQSRKMEQAAAKKSRSSRTSTKIRVKGQHGEDLCARCKTIGLDKLFPTADDISTSHGLPIMDLGLITQETETAGCALCRLFAITRTPGTSKPGSSDWHRDRYHLRAFTSHKVYSVSKRTLHATVKSHVALKVLGGHPSKTMHRSICRNDCVGGGLIIPVARSRSRETQSLALEGCEVDSGCVEYDRLRGWLDVCQMSHTKSCGLRTSTRPTTLKVLDCVTREVVQIREDDQYVALSYVWGRNHRDPSPQNMPQVIIDASTVTRNLHKRYLWIDKYCIDQDDDDDKHAQIQSMDRIYEGAFCTIIAASGEDAQSSLPGVSSPRIHQPSAVIGGKRLISTMSQLSTLLGDSTWATRGWTYQEALLSRRCLFFTSEQVHFVCRNMDCCESFNKPPDLATNRVASSGGSRTLPIGIFSHGDTFPPRGNGAFEICSKQLSTYTRRQLTYGEDVLNAFRGMLNRSLFRSFWGVHIASWRFQTGTEADIGFARGLFWSTHKVLRRRSGFPSWSWAGWESCEQPPTAIYYSPPRGPLNLRDSDRKKFDTSFNVQDKDLNFVKLRDALQDSRANECLPEISPYIEIYGFMVQIQLQSSDRNPSWRKPFCVCHCHPASPHGTRVGSSVDHSPALLCEFPIDDGRDGRGRLSQPCDAVKLFNDTTGFGNGGAALLLIEWHGGTAERIGSVEIPDSIFDALPKERRNIRLR